MLHNRRQYAVGQGCFHAGLVGASATASFPDPISGPGVRYVYDCGSMPKYTAARNAEIDRFHQETGRARIDFLFLSHMHEDHVSGVERLCDPQAGSPVDTVVLPLLNAIDRLICFARAAAEAPDGDNEFMRAMALNPAVALERINPRQIIFVHRGGESGAPSPDGPGPEHPEGPFDDREHDDHRGDTKWRLIGRGGSRRMTPSQANKILEVEAPEIFEVDDTCAFVLNFGGEAQAWLLAPYVDEEVSLSRTAFIEKAADLFGLTPGDFEQQAKQPSWLLKAVTQDKKLLAEAYASVANLNVTSLCLYSGPFGSASGKWMAKVGVFQHAFDSVPDVGWFGTGDADLKKPARRIAFKTHYAPYLTSARTLLLPHHGSEHNFNADLLAAIEPTVTVASAAPFAKWRHPGTAVIQAVASRGHPLWVVTDSLSSSIHEVVLIA